MRRIANAKDDLEGEGWEKTGKGEGVRKKQGEEKGRTAKKETTK
jgi:hypothetical protein